MVAALSSPLIELLKATSRTFYRTLRILPAVVRTPISLAYLLARTTDTIADTEIIPVNDRLQALQRLRHRILGAESRPLELGELAQRQGSPADRALLDHIEDSLAALHELAVADRQLARRVLDTIASGQELDLRRFHDASIERIIALRTDAELDDYTYRVAGCVGEFWTKMCRRHLFPHVPLDEVQFLADAICFGKGLQLVNILRDLPADLRKGRCYLPEERLVAIGLTPADLLQPANEERFRTLYHGYLHLAESHLAAGWSYTNCIPWRQMRVRLACAWPILIGVETIKRLRVENVLNPRRRVKISRAEVRRLILYSLLAYPWPSVWKGLAKSAESCAGKPVASGANLT